MDIQEVRFGGVDWIYVAQDRDRSRVIVNAVTNLWIFVFHKMQEISWLSEDLLASQEGLCFMELVILSA
jgi:hypothetical protein